MKCPQCGSEMELDSHRKIPLMMCYNCGYIEGRNIGPKAKKETNYEHLKTLDSTRFIDTASGWFKGADSDVDSEHIYFKPVKLKYSEKPMVLSEFGGYSYKPEGHVFNPVNTYGYRFFKEQADFEAALIKLYEEEIIPAVGKGLCGAVYTQVSDVEDETNGLLSYDRRVCKISPDPMNSIAEKLRDAMEPS